MQQRWHTCFHLLTTPRKKINKMSSSDGFFLAPARENEETHIHFSKWKPGATEFPDAIHLASDPRNSRAAVGELHASLPDAADLSDAADPVEPVRMDRIRSHHVDFTRNHNWLVFIGESSFQGFLGGAGFRPSTVS